LNIEYIQLNRCIYYSHLIHYPSRYESPLTGLDVHFHLFHDSSAHVNYIVAAAFGIELHFAILNGSNLVVYPKTASDQEGMRTKIHLCRGITEKVEAENFRISR